MQCHSDSKIGINPNGSSIALIGHPNMGKSVLFHRLTGQHVAVANYPGTTVDVSRGIARALYDTTMVDTPGVVTFPPHTEDELVTERVLLQEPLKAILQVGDAKNIRRTLALTIQLAEFGLPLVLAINMMDEADTRGVEVNYPLLSTKHHLPIITTIGVFGRRIEDLTAALNKVHRPRIKLNYPLEIEAAVADICPLFSETPVGARAIALLWLCGDEVIDTWLHRHCDESTFQKLITYREGLQFSFAEPIPDLIQLTRQAFVEEISSSVILETGEDWNGLSSGLGRLTTHPAWGLMNLVLVMFGLYWFVGDFRRRDFGAVGLFRLESQGLLSPLQVVVAMVTITLFIPCFASVLMIAIERGRRIATGMIALIFPLAFLVGGMLYRILLSIDWIL